MPVTTPVSLLSREFTFDGKSQRAIERQAAAIRAANAIANIHSHSLIDFEVKDEDLACLLEFVVLAMATQRREGEYE